jgi:hypothetical protein
MTIHRDLLPAALAVAVLLPISVLAHHPLDEVYGRDSSITLTGTVTRVEWVNPHASFRLSARDDTGATVEWLVELDPPGALARRGWTGQSILAGQVVTVAGFLAHDGSPQTYARTVTLPGNESLVASSEGSWSWRRASEVLIPN